ncbi:MAG: hypothetical protein ACNYPE_10525 [Candidatus Azotimanducaceae bacterium WSBS_2022_MAG_OTU7]
MSTRGGVQGLSFCDAVMMGLADDGGLLVPESIPDVSEDLLLLAGKGYGFVVLTSWDTLLMIFPRLKVGAQSSSVVMEPLMYRRWRP